MSSRQHAKPGVDGARALVVVCSMILGVGLLLEGSRGAALGAASVLSLGIVSVLVMPRPVPARPAGASVGRVAALESRVDGLREALAAVSARQGAAPMSYQSIAAVPTVATEVRGPADEVLLPPVAAAAQAEADEDVPDYVGRHARPDALSPLLAALDRGWDLPQLRFRDPLPAADPIEPVRVITLPLVWKGAALAPVVSIRRGA